MKRRRPTIKDIAQKLNISPSTVSRALKNHPDISEKTKTEIQLLAKQLNYKPNSFALSLKSQKSKTIGIIIPEIIHYFFSSVISGIEEVFYDAGYTVIICQSNEEYEREVKITRALLEKGVDGIIACISKNTVKFTHYAEVQAQNIPLVFMDRVVPQIFADQVMVDDFEAAFKAASHLIERGRKNLVHLAGPQTLLIGKHRKEGFLHALQKANLPIDDMSVIVADNYEKAEDAVNKLIKSNKKVDGIFAVNDLTAIGAMHTFQTHNMKVPQDISIIGFSDGRLSNITTPKLSSVNQHGYEMGAVASKMLLNRMNSEEDYPYERKVIDVELIIRGSS